MHDVVGVQSAGGSATGHRAAAVAVLQGAAEAGVDGAGGPTGSDDAAVAFEPHFAGRIAEQIPAVLVGEQWAQVQGCDVCVDVEVRDDGGVLPVWPGSHVGVPAGFDEAHERIDTVRERRSLPGHLTLAVLGGGDVIGIVIAFPGCDQCVAMRPMGGVEFRRFDAG